MANAKRAPRGTGSAGPVRRRVFAAILVAAAFLLPTGVLAVAQANAPVRQPSHVVYGTVSQHQWDTLVEHGWRGDPRDGTDSVIYSPGELDASGVAR